MAHSHSHNLWSTPPASAVSSDSQFKSVRQSCVAPFSERCKERIKDMFNKVELSVSSYDTAWVAMVPSPHSPQSPYFPRSLSWILNNQLRNGSWGLPDCHPSLIKDSLLSTVACVLALTKWRVGERQINKGLEYIASNSSFVTDVRQLTPIGFHILLSGMIEKANSLNLNLPLKPEDVDTIFDNRDLEVERGFTGGSGIYLSYVSEGMGSLADWEMIMKYQRKNGSLFNSPSTTAAALADLQNAHCLHYIESVLEKFGDAVPTIYPLEIYARLCMVDNVERLGIGCHFKEEINRALDNTYRCWLQGEEEIFLDIATLATAFRILRAHGYDISSDAFIKLAEEDNFSNSLEGHVKDMGSVMELYRASQLIIQQDEIVLEKVNSWTHEFLRKGLLVGEMHANRLEKYIRQEVDDTLRFPLPANLEKVANRRNIELYNTDSTRILKSGLRSYNFGNKDFLSLAVDDFNHCQALWQEELKHLERWVAEKKLDKLQFARQKLAFCYFSAAATFSPSDLSDARIAWAKNGVLTTVVDDFFDVGGSALELENLIQLVRKLNVNVSADCCSEPVEIIFSALHSTICEIADKAAPRQGRSVMGHVTQIWLDLLESMSLEAKWTRDKSVPTMDEYMENAFVSFALGPIVLPTLYLVGPKLSEKQVESIEYHNLFRLMSTCGRLLNDIQGFKRESKQGKLNALTLQMLHEDVASTEDEVTEKLKGIITSNRRELLNLVLQEKDSIIPRACKDLFWKMSTVLHFFYMEDDGFTSNAKIKAVKDLLGEPITVNQL